MQTKKKLKNSELLRKSIAEFKKAAKTPLIVVLDNVRSLHNIGSIFRTSDAFLIEKIYLCGISATPPHKDIQKTALGATDSVTWEYVEDCRTLIKKLQHDGVKILAIEQTQNAVMLHEFIPEQDTTYAVIFGNEVKGVQQAVVTVSDQSIEIPQLGTKHSLNIAVSAGIVLWDLLAKMKQEHV